eukprot:SRR837773.13414.p2 GENE.SRR837773.13414~~SRR837773.13414.p2  ORF type:complete len:122 (-),score=5.46 SRR837773.13414:625-990(-)
MNTAVRFLEPTTGVSLHTENGTTSEITTEIEAGMLMRTVKGGETSTTVSSNEIGVGGQIVPGTTTTSCLEGRLLELRVVHCLTMFSRVRHRIPTIGQHFLGQQLNPRRQCLLVHRRLLPSR